MREELRNEVDSMLEIGVVRLSMPQYASPSDMINKRRRMVYIGYVLTSES